MACDILKWVMSMARQARKLSETGIYHIMLQSVNQQQIFEDDEDYKKLLKIIAECKEISGFKLYAYCLMGNHFHLLIKQEDESLDTIFRRICGKFVYWYNVKYDRSGHLFQGRFRSEPVEDDAYLLTVLRYIHQNPVKAGLCEDVSEYTYSSFNEYMEDGYLIDHDFIFGLLPLSEFERFNKTICQENCLDVSLNKKIRMTDEKARQIISKYSKCLNATEFQALDKKLRDRYLKKIAEKGLSIRQVSRVTGVSTTIVRKFY